MSSLYESIVWEQLTGYESVSTISVFRKAKEEGIELLQITKDNLETQLEKLDTDDVTKQAVRNAVGNGNMVTIPAADVTIGEWSGTGYIIMDESGAGSYMITGGLNGGEIPAELTIQVIVSAIVAVMGTGTLITTLCASIFATICPVATVVACAALILIATIWIVDMYCSYYDYIYSGDLDSYNDTSNMAMQLYMLGDMQLMASQFIFAHYAAPYLGKEKGESTGTTGSKTVEELLNGLTETTNGKGIARNFESIGGFEQATKDFTSLNPNNVKTIQTQYGEGMVGTLNDGTTVVARPGSATGGATLEIRVSNNKIYKIRY